MSHDTPVSVPRLPAPPGARDTHLHIYEPGYDMRAGSSHPSQPATLAHYREIQKRLGLTRAVIVQLQCESREIGSREAMLAKLPCDLVIDHITNPARLYGFR